MEAVIRNGLKKFTNEVGRLWVALGEFCIGSGNFERARDVYEEGMKMVMTVRDFGQIWDAYSRFEYGLLAKEMEQMASFEGHFIIFSLIVETGSTCTFFLIDNTTI